MFPEGPTLETDAPAQPRARAGPRLLVGGAAGGGLTSVAVAAQAILEAYIPKLMPALEAEQVPMVASGLVAGAGIVIGAAWAVLGPVIARKLTATMGALVAILSLGCAFGVGPVGVAFGQAAVCRGPATTYYSVITGDVEAEHCEGGYVMGGPLSDAGARTIEGGARIARRGAAAVLGLPSPPAQEVTP